MLDKDSEKTSTELVERKSQELFNPQTAAAGIREDQKKIVQDIISAPSRKELQQYIEEFNLSQTKKNALRIIKLTDLLDKVEDQANERFTRRPDEISNKELLDYMQVVSGQIERSQKSLADTLDEKKPLIQINTQNNETNNINVAPKLSRESREKVIDVVTQLLKSVNKGNATIEENDIPSNDTITTDYTVDDESKN